MKRAASIIMALASAALLTVAALVSSPSLMAQDAATQATGNRRAYVVHRASAAKATKKGSTKKGTASARKAASATPPRATTTGSTAVGAGAEGSATATSGRRR